jgi:hypothetical protein
VSPASFDLPNREVELNNCVVPLEAVSGILQTNLHWEPEIAAFWSAQKAVFHELERSTRAGTHIHITPGPAKQWSTDQVRRIAVGVVRYEELVQKMLPQSRQTQRMAHNPTTINAPVSYTGDQHSTHYCRSNTSSSTSLNDRFNREGSPVTSELSSRWDMADLLVALPKSRADKVRELERSLQGMNKAQIVREMQGDRRVLWNFDNIEQSKKTIEFRGGRGMRGLNRTRWWIAFVVGFIHYLLTEV